MLFVLILIQITSFFIPKNKFNTNVFSLDTYLKFRNDVKDNKISVNDKVYKTSDYLLNKERKLYGKVYR